MYDINHIQKITRKGERLEAFQNSWSMALSELKTPPDPEILRYSSLKQAQCFTPLAEEIARYRSAKLLENKADYSFECLFEAANWYLLMKREDAMQEALSRGFMR